MDHKSIMVYRMAEELQEKYKELAFFDMETDNPETAIVLQSAEISRENNYPLILLYRNGKLINASFGIQSNSALKEMLHKQFSETINA